MARLGIDPVTSRSRVRRANHSANLPHILSPLLATFCRWRLFGHILRRDSQIPANQAMSGYFVTEGSKFKERPLTTLPVILNRDLSRIINSNLQLKSSHDLEHLRSIAQQRDEWTKLTARIREAAEASQSVH
ncbi:hypothetical protein ElyMa_001320300 [Elysia marginata]|uniref:Uncharacterized protein n=1 Tax=Elysia marginata TaxID=1093978 RepID=A0AAV4IKM6_9GAST|nr:hypothetical protein ElyMa_001320300 [Elysia marginata]